MIADLAAYGLCEYVPDWPSYHARRLTEVVITNGEETHEFAVAYRVRTMIGERELTLIMPLPDCLPELPLGDRDVVASLEAAVRRSCESWAR